MYGNFFPKIRPGNIEGWLISFELELLIRCYYIDLTLIQGSVPVSE